MVRVLGRLPLKDEAAYTGGRRPRSLRGGNRGTGSLGGAGAMEIVVLAVVARCAWLAEVGPREAVARGGGGARGGPLRRRGGPSETPQSVAGRRCARPLPSPAKTK